MCMMLIRVCGFVCFCVCLCEHFEIRCRIAHRHESGVHIVGCVWIVLRVQVDGFVCADYIMPDLNKTTMCTTHSFSAPCDCLCCQPKPPGASEQMPDSHTEIVRIHFQVCNPTRETRKPHTHTRTHRNPKQQIYCVFSRWFCLGCRRRRPNRPTEYLSHGAGIVPRGFFVRVRRAAGVEPLRPAQVQSQRLHGRAEIVLSRCARGAQPGRGVLPVQVSTVTRKKSIPLEVVAT